MDRRDLLIGAASASASLAQSPTAAPNTSSVMLWTLKGSFEEKLEAAARAGIQSVELVGEHYEWTSAEIDRIKKLARSLKLGMDTISSTPFWGRMPISMVDPAQRGNLLKEVQKNIDSAQRLEIPMLLLMSGNAIPSKPYAEQWASLVEGAKRCGDLAAKANVTLIVEPLNTKVNHKGYFLDSCVGGVKLMKEVDHPNVRLLFDLYHEQVQVGDVTRTLREAMPYVKVFHIADNPGRNDPGTGEMNYPYLYKEIQKAGYKGYLTMEYIPLGDQVKSLTTAVDSMRKALA
jgi:hydroxypyruvate isomerase